jgi:hypothetical protein
MYINKVARRIKPLIFTKKLDNNLKIIPLNKTKNTLGPIRYFPPANQEWVNSIYAYNSTYIKNITIADKNLSRLIKSYFNIFLSKKLLYSKRVLTRFRRLVVNKVFVSKAELKHTGSKVIITLYVYNEERRALLNRLKKIEAVLFPSFNLNETYKNKTLSLKKKLNMVKKENFSFLTTLEKCRKHIIEEINLKEEVLETINKFELKSKKILEIKTLKESVNKLLTVTTACENNPISYRYYREIHNKFVNKILLEKEIITLVYFKLLLSLNKSKFEDKFLLRLKPFIGKIYNKEVEFNIVNLKAIYLNSDIFTQAISLKLRNRNNRLLTVLRYFLHMIKLSKINLFKERFYHLNMRKL